MHFTEWVTQRGTAAWAVFILVALGGIVSFLGLPRAEFPDFTIRTAVVTALYPGASPDRVERLLTEPLEAALQGMEEIDYIESESRRGTAVLWVNVRSGYDDVRPIWDDLRRRMDDLAPRLPPEVVGPVVNDRFGDVFGILVALTGKGHPYDALEQAAEEAERRISRLQDVAEVNIVGVQEERVFIEYDEARLARSGLDPERLQGMLRDRGTVRSVGAVHSAEERIELEASGPFHSLEELRSFPIPQADGSLISLGDVTTVRMGFEDPPARQMTYNGDPGLALAVSMSSEGQITTFGPKVIRELETLRSELPAGMELHAVTYEAAVVDDAIREFLFSLALAIGIVVLVMLAFLGLRAGMVTAAVIPLTVLGTVLAMRWLDLGINRITIAALILSLGLVVDCAIVIAESIRARMRGGVSVREAARDAAGELHLPLLASMLATAAALLPIFLAEHPVGEMTGALFLVVGVAVVLSWIFSITAIPSLAVRWFGSGRSAKDPGKTSDPRFLGWYRSALVHLLRHRALTLGVAVVLLVGAIGLFRVGVPQQFFPTSQEATFTVALELSGGSSFDRTRAAVDAVEGFMAEELMAEPAGGGGAGEILGHFSGKRTYERGGVVNWAAFVGSGAPRFNLSYAPEHPRAEYAIVQVNTTSFRDQRRVMAELRGFVAETLPEARVRVSRVPRGPPIDYPVEVRISGPDANTLQRLAESVERRLFEADGTANVSRDWGLEKKLFRVDIEPERSARAGVSRTAVVNSLQARLSEVPLTGLRRGDELVPVVLRSNEAGRPDLSVLSGLGVPGGAAENGWISLEEVARLDLGFEPSRIRRHDRERTVTVRADVAPEAPASTTPFAIVEELDAWLADEARSWPSGYHFAYGGEVETSTEARGAIAAKAPIALVGISLLLVVLFNSLRKAGVILLALPFGLVGVFLGLFLTRAPFSFMAILGVIGLIGVMINQAVVLVRRIEAEEAGRGEAGVEAIVAASVRRFTPIVMATLTTMGGVLALWLNGEPMFVPLAIAMFFGLLFSLIITLGLVPVLYAVVYRVRGPEAEWNQEGPEWIA